MKYFKKIFGGIDLNWRRLFIFAIVSGVYTSLVSILPQVKDTSLHTIAVSFEVWIFFGLFIIMNSKSNIDSALKCFVFFLISQPLVYLLQVPFSIEGWSIFRFYKYWFIWTILCFPMGYIGYYLKKDKWWGYLILLPMILLTASSYSNYLSYFTFCYPYYLLISLFCVVVMLLYPIVLINNNMMKIIGTIISLFLVVFITAMTFINPYKYSTEILSTVDGKDISNDYQVSLADDKYGNVFIQYIDSIDSYMIHADFKRKGKTELILNTPDGVTKIYDLIIDLNSFEIKEK